MCVCVRYNFDEFVDALLRYGVTHAPLVPPILLQLVKNNLGEHFDRTKLKLKTVLTAAAPLGTELQKAFESKFPGVEVQQVMQQITSLEIESTYNCRHGGRFHDMSSYSIVNFS
jgi:acyl-CoA synthetase (AMP-forming)/AMP-acid ligase II